MGSRTQGRKKVPDNTGDFFVLARVAVLRKDNTLSIVNHKMIYNVVCQSAMDNMGAIEINTTMIHKVAYNTVIHKVIYSYVSM